MPTRRSLVLALSLVLACCCLAALLRADEDGDENGEEKPKAASKQDEKKAADPAAPAAEGKKGPDFATLVKDHRKIEGLYTLYLHKESLRALIPASKTKRPFLLAISMSQGPWAGILWQETMVRWEAHGDKLLLVEPETRFRAAEGTPLGQAVERTSTETILRAVPVLARGPANGYLVDLAGVFKTDLAGLAASLGGLSGELSRWASVKSFPENVELAVDLAYARGDRARRHRVHYSLRDLPETGYKPRQADPRVGYFTTVLRDYSRPHHDRTAFTRYVQRWHLEKADPTLALSPPKRPLVWYIEKTVPFRFRRWVAEGILEWNKAFEKVGLVGALVVRQQQDQGEFDDLDPEDARYNFFRWGTANVGYAFGPSRNNPLTGESLDSDIYFDDSVVRANLRYFRKLDVLTRSAGGDPKLERFLARHPAWLRLLAPGEEARRSPSLPPAGPRARRPDCCFAQGKAHQLALAALALGKESAGELPEEFLGQVIKETVMHEVGHCLGLRHNFKASAWRRLEEITGKERVLAISGSVMDYNGINFPLEQGEAKNYQMTTLGPYDYWAIAYGYSAAGEDEAKTLAGIAAQSSARGHDYATDEDTGFLDPDPHASQWDLGDDLLAGAKRTLALVERLSGRLIEKSVPAGESYYHARRAFDTLLNEYGWACRLAARYVGGSHVHRDHRGSPGERPPLQPVAAARQREALELLARTVFSPSSFRYPPALLAALAPGRWEHDDSDAWDAEIAYSLPARVRSIHAAVLLQLFNAHTLRRVESAPLVAGAGERPLQTAELFATVGRAVWSELDAPFREIALLRRNLQRLWTDLLVELARGTGRDPWPTEARSLAWDALRQTKARLDARLASVAAGALEAATEAHLRETAATIERALRPTER